MTEVCVLPLVSDINLAASPPASCLKRGRFQAWFIPQNVLGALEAARLLMKPSIGQEVVNKSAEVLQMMRRKGFPVLHVRTGHAENLSDSSRQDLQHMW